MDSAANLQATTADLQSKINAERLQYVNFKRLLADGYPDTWKDVEKALVAIASYYRAEQVKAKHDLALYMQGHDITAAYGASDLIESAHLQINRVPGIIHDVDAAKKGAKRFRNDPIQYGTMMTDVEFAEKALAAELDLLREITTEIEGITYAAA